MRAPLRVAASTCAVLLSSLFVLPTAGADSGDCSTEATAHGSYYNFTGTCATDPQGLPGTSGPNKPAGKSPPSPYTAYKWASICTSDPDTLPGDVNCSAALNCPDPRQLLWQLWGRFPDGSWTTVTTGCFGGTPAAPEPATVTPGDVLTALRRVGLPELTTVVQPADRTLVNFDTNFYTEPRPVDLTLTLLDQEVRVEATPASYRWHFGDGTSATTTDPGAAYPELAVTHRYADARVTVRPHVETTYTARFRVRGGDWQDVGGTVTATGPPTALRVAEATPLLSGDHR